MSFYARNDTVNCFFNFIKILVGSLRLKQRQYSKKVINKIQMPYLEVKGQFNLCTQYTDLKTSTSAVQTVNLSHHIGTVWCTKPIRPLRRIFKIPSWGNHIFTN